MSAVRDKLCAVVDLLPRCPALHRLYLDYYAYPRDLLSRPRRSRQGYVLASKDTRVVIEGYPRSANSFAVLAFYHAQGGAIDWKDIAHHWHSWVQVKTASRFGIPAMVLVRNPEDAVLSQHIRNPDVSMAGGLRRYIAFYENSFPFRGDFVVAPFEAVTTDFGSVIRRLNEKFGTAFREFHHGEADMKVIFSHIEQIEKNRPGLPFKQRVARPSQARREMKGRIRHEFYGDDLARLRRRAFEIYEKFMALAKR